MNSSKKSTWIIVLLMCFVMSIPSCERTRRIERQTVYNESISDMEVYLLEDFGDCYIIEEPTILQESKSIRLTFTFLTSFIHVAKVEGTVVDAMENTRLAINAFLHNNPEYFMNEGYRIYIEFWEASETYNTSLPPGEMWGALSNRVSRTSTAENYMCCVYYSFRTPELDNTDLSFEGITAFDCRNMIGVDHIKRIIDLMPDLEVVYVYSDLIQELSDYRPDIEFVSSN